MTYPTVGTPVPPFELSADDGSTVSSSSLAGRRYLLYFYPKDDTPGCTAQACSLRDNIGRLADAGIEVFGISPDSVKSHVRFRAKYELPYHLLADDGHRVADEFGVWVEKSYMGRTFKGIERTSFVIGPDGRVEHVLPRVKPTEHVDLVLEALDR
jgi:thioredoxin-dependent peroxiredoxin